MLSLYSQVGLVVRRAPADRRAREHYSAPGRLPHYDCDRTQMQPLGCRNRHLACGREKKFKKISGKP
jgi:hypothetical protein